MGSLSDEEKARIREEISYREEIREILATDDNKKEPHPIIRILNSAFVVAVIGGLFIAYLGHQWQQSSAEQHKEIVKLENASKYRFELLYNFVQNFESTTMVLGAMTKYRIVLADLKTKRKEDLQSVPDDEYKSIEAIYQDTWKLYHKAPKINAIEIQIRARYKDKAVTLALDELDKSIIKLQRSNSLDEVERNMAIIQNKYELLSNAMIVEAARKEF